MGKMSILDARLRSIENKAISKGYTTMQELQSLCPGCYDVAETLDEDSVALYYKNIQDRASNIIDILLVNKELSTEKANELKRNFGIPVENKGGFLGFVTKKISITGFFAKVTGKVYNPDPIYNPDPNNEPIDPIDMGGDLPPGGGNNQGYCGDCICGDGEGVGSCREDCDNDINDGYCSCAEDLFDIGGGDCEEDDDRCGNAVCDTAYGENSGNCPADCGGTCGDGICKQGEKDSCKTDCHCTSGSNWPECNPESGETVANCYNDCHCGDNVCATNQIPLECISGCQGACPADCNNYCDMDDICEDGSNGDYQYENVATCADCWASGNGRCDPGETTCNNPGDCGSRCGDRCCNGGENTGSCIGDCPASCGDHSCDGNENSNNCPGDCYGEDDMNSCGDGVCIDYEKEDGGAFCEEDCINAICGNAICEGGENPECSAKDCDPESYYKGILQDQYNFLANLANDLCDYFTVNYPNKAKFVCLAEEIKLPEDDGGQHYECETDGNCNINFQCVNHECVHKYQVNDYYEGIDDQYQDFYDPNRSNDFIIKQEDNNVFNPYQEIINDNNQYQDPNDLVDPIQNEEYADNGIYIPPPPPDGYHWK